MSTMDLVLDALASEWLAPYMAGDSVAVPTTCLRDTGSWITVYVTAGTGRVRVHDGGMALWESRDSGFTGDSPQTIIRGSVEAYGASVGRDGVIYADTTPGELAQTIVLVANASRDASNALLHRVRMAKPRDLKAALGELLVKRFSQRVHSDVRIGGSSNRQHRFAFMLTLSSDKALLIDPVKRDANSINSRVVAHLDVHNMNRPDLEQRLVYDDDEDWDSPSLMLLGVGAKAVAYSGVGSMLERMAA